MKDEEHKVKVEKKGTVNQTVLVPPVEKLSPDDEPSLEEEKEDKKKITKKFKSKPGVNISVHDTKLNISKVDEIKPESKDSIPEDDSDYVDGKVPS